MESRVGSPRAVGHLRSGVTNENRRAHWLRIVFPYLWHAVRILVVHAGDVRAVNIIQLDFETVSLDPGVVDAIEVIEDAVCTAGIR